MASLTQLEALFWRAVRSDRPLAEVEAQFAGSVELSAARRMAIYRSAYWLRQERVLADTFPRVAAIVGAERFHRLVADYLTRYPSERPAIEWIGRHFPEALGSCHDIPACLRDLARLEWARLEVLLAPATTVFCVDELRSLDFSEARAQLCPSVRVLELSQWVLQAWREPAACGAASESAERAGCLVWRRGHAASHRSLDQSEYEALELLRAGHTFGQICSVFAEPGAAEKAARCIGRWFRDGLLCAPDPREGAV
jgi:hypothetical protein